MSYPIPSAALDDRQAFVGTAGSGKTYNSGTGVERLLQAKARVGIPDPLGVWYGLGFDKTGRKPSIFRERGQLVIFGGPRGDLPLTENAGALIGETVAGMKESFILDLSELGTKAAERRFMLHFLQALYKHKTKDPLHVIFDEADMWAPQQIRDKEGEATKLYGMMETIVRRGRVRGFIPWLITQRPAVLSKDVLSQIDGLVAFKLTSSQDRDAIGDWVQGQADKAQWREIWSKLPTMERGQGVVWLPARGILKTAKFPEKTTFDSSRTPKRGEKVQRVGALKPLNLDKVKERLSVVEAEVKSKSTDVPALRKEIVQLRADLARAQQQKPADPKADRAAIETAEKRGFELAKKKLKEAADKAAKTAAAKAIATVGKRVSAFGTELHKELQNVQKDLELPSTSVSFTPSAPPAIRPAYAPPRPAPVPAARPKAPAAPASVKPADGEFSVTPARQKILDAIAWAASIGDPAVPKDMVAFLAGTTPTSSAYQNNLGSMRSAGLIDYPGGGKLVALTTEGNAIANQPTVAMTHEALLAKVREVLPPVYVKILEAAAASYPHDMTKEELAAAAATTPTSSAFQNNLGKLRTLGLLTYPAGGRVRADDRLFPDRRAA